MTSNDEETDIVIQAGVLDYIEVLVDTNEKSVRKEVCWALSNITAGSPA